MNVKPAELEKQQKTILSSPEQRVELLKYFQEHDGPEFGQFFSEWGLDLRPILRCPTNAGAKTFSVLILGRKASRMIMGGSMPFLAMSYVRRRCGTAFTSK